MATIQYGSSTTGGPAFARFTDSGLSYQSLDGDVYQNTRKVLNDRFAAAETHARATFEKFYRFEKLYNMIVKNKSAEWKANVALPYAFAMTEQAAAMKYLALFLSRPYVTVQSRRAEMDEVALRRQALIDWRLTGDLNVLEVAPPLFRISERYGTAIGRIEPAWDTSILKFRAPAEAPSALGQAARMSWKMRESKEYRLRLTACDNTDVFPEPGRRTINGDHAVRWMFHRQWLTISELQALEAANLIGPSVGGQSVAEIGQSAPQDSTNDYKLRRLFLGGNDDYQQAQDLYDRPVELLTYQGVVPRECIHPQIAEMEASEGMDPYNRLVIMANRSTILQSVSMPWDHGKKSFIKIDSVQDPYDFWAKGKIEPIEHSCYAANEISNARLDNLRMAINALIGVNGNMMPAGWKRRLVSQPFGVVETNGPPGETIQRLQVGDVTSSSYVETQEQWALIQEADGLNETMMGAPGPARTLGEHQLKAESGSKRLQFELIVQANQLLGFPSGLSGFIIGYDRQYLPIPTYLRVAAPQSPDDFIDWGVGWKTLASEDESFAYMPTGATEGINIAAKRADLSNLVIALSPMLQLILMQGFNLPEFSKMILKTFGHDPTKFWPPMQGTMDASSPAAQRGMPMGMMGASPGSSQPTGPPGMPPPTGIPLLAGLNR